MAHSHGILIPEEAKASSPEMHGCDFTYCPASPSSDIELHNLTVTTTKAAASLQPGNQAFPVCQYKAEQHTIPCYFLHHLCKEVVIHVLDVLCLTVLLVQQVSEWLISPIRNRASGCRTISSSCRRPHRLPPPDQVACCKHP